MKLFILGSCVSRDIFNFKEESKNFSLYRYYARTSIASISNFNKFESKINLNLIDSKFQREMVEKDLNKTFLEDISDDNYDLLLIDFINERFNLCIYNDSICTVSNELLKSDFNVNNSKYQIVKPFTDEYLSIWEKGWKKLVEILKNNGVINKIVINKVFWSISKNDGSVYEIRRISQANDFLAKLYSIVEKDISINNFIKFDKDILVSNIDHIWGIAPFHFIDKYYIFLINELKKYTPEYFLFDYYSIINSNIRKKITNLEINTNINEFYILNFDWKKCFTQKESSKIEKLFYLMRDNSLFLDFLNQSIDNNVICLDSLFEDSSKAYCNRSFYVSNRNFLEFRDINEVFFIVQHHKTARALYFPLRKCTIVIDKIELPVNSIQSLNNEIIRCKDLIIKNQSKKRHFSGIIGSYGRPYHFFYDTLPIIYYGYKYNENFNKIQNIYLFEQENYLSIKELFDLDCKEYVINYRALNEKLISEATYCLKLGYGETKFRDSKTLFELDKKLIDKSLSVVEKSEFNDIFKEAISSRKVIWFGICAEKRSWKEQTQTIIKIIERLLKENYSICFIFDGLTKTFSEEQEDFQRINCSEELKIFNQIKKIIPEFVPVINLIGAGSEIKIAFSSITNFFLTNFLTDSLYVSRISKKFGISYGSNVSTYLEHFHPNTYIVPKKYSSDITTDSNWSKVSYSISTDTIFNFFFELIDQEQLLTNKPIIYNNSEKIFIDNTDNFISFKVSLDASEVKYLPVDEKIFNIKSLGKNYHFIDKNLKYIFKCATFGWNKDLSISLVISSFSKEGHLNNYFINENSNEEIIFDEQEIYFRLFIRLKGFGNIFLSNIFFYTTSKEKISEIANSSEQLTKEELIKSVIFKDFFLIKKLQTSVYSIKYNKKSLIEMKYLNKNSKNLMIFFNAAISRTEKTVLPIFSGASISENLDSNVLMINDPSLYLSNNLSLGWYLGNQYINLQKILLKIIKHIEKLVFPEKLIFFGGSGGGFASLYYSSYFKNSIAIVSNPQINILNYDQGSVERYFLSAFDIGSFNYENYKEVLVKNGITWDVSELYKKSENKIVYLQNIYDNHHIQKHLNSFLNKNDLNLNIEQNHKIINMFENRLLLILARNWGKGHVGANKKFLFEILNYFLINDYNNTKTEDILEYIYFNNINYIDYCSLNFKDNRIFVEVGIDKSLIDYEVCFYLYLNGTKIESTKYSKELKVNFLTKETKGLFWAVCFLRTNSIKQTLKSKKLKLL
ncbi:MAG: DUF6270 domain-containing protein [Aliarcobacter sp.]|nr:DUF6270 domain-containing protein [Aliarcobacter sp.]